MIAVSLTTLDDTRQVADALASALSDGDIIELRGSIGAGKTTLVSMLVHILGSGEVARSPTYTVAHEYQLGDGRTCSHLDLYRHEGAMSEEAWGDIEPAFDAAVVCVEWPGESRAWYANRPIWSVHLELAAPERRVAWLVAPTAHQTHEVAETLARHRRGTRGATHP